MRRSNSLKIVLALIAVYIVWGTTYLGIRFGLEGFPPLILNGIRFVIAGSALAMIARSRRQPWPTPKQWWNGARTGILMMVGGVGLVAVSESLGVGSGLVATAVAVIPVWIALITGLLGQWPTRREWIGLVIGLIGVVVLIGEADFRATLAGTILVLISPILWSIGSVWSTRLDLPAGSAMTTALQLLSGGVAMLIIGPARGERILEMPGAQSWLALGYLIVFGSIVAYTSYVFLLKTVRPSLATSYAYVNPVVAVLAGVTIAGEALSGPVFFAMPLILTAVAMATWPSRRMVTEPEPVVGLAPVEEAA